MSEELKPCPFHWAGCDQGVEIREDQWCKWYRVVSDCGAAGPEGLRRDWAIEAWNERVSAPLDVEVAHCYVPRVWWERLRAKLEELQSSPKPPENKTWREGVEEALECVSRWVDRIEKKGGDDSSHMLQW